MMASEIEVAELLAKWRDSNQSVCVAFSGSDSDSWQQTGEVTQVGLPGTTFEVHWDNGEVDSFAYNVVAGTLKAAPCFT